MEFFCSPSSFRALEARLAERPSVTYMAVNAAGQSATNVPAGAARAPAVGGAPGAPPACPRLPGLLRCVDAALCSRLHVLTRHLGCNESELAGYGYWMTHAQARMRWRLKPWSARARRSTRSPGACSRRARSCSRRSSTRSRSSCGRRGAPGSRLKRCSGCYYTENTAVLPKNECQAAPGGVILWQSLFPSPTQVFMQCIRSSTAPVLELRHTWRCRASGYALLQHCWVRRRLHVLGAAGRGVCAVDGGVGQPVRAGLALAHRHRGHRKLLARAPLPRAS